MARALAQRNEGPAEDDLFARIGAFLCAQRLNPEPAHYAFAYNVLSDPEGELARAVAHLTDDGVRLSRTDIESLGGTVGPSRAERPSIDAKHVAAEQQRTDRLAAETEVQAAELAGVVRAMRDETRGFGRDLAEHAAAIHQAGVSAGLADIARITGAMLARISESEQRLAEATRETEELRAKLAEARATARRDPLTGLPNRRAFEEAYAVKAGQKLHLALCDVDRFKRINDGYGHAVGDRVLSAIADCLRVACDGHLVARHGGEEFAVLIAGLSLEKAGAALEEARAAVAAKRFRTRETDKLIGRVTLSVGLTAVAPGEALETAFARADRFLYNAKSTGRDRLCKG